MRLVVLLGLLAGCDKLFSLQHVNEPPRTDAVADTSRDGVVADSPPDGLQTHSSCPASFGVPFGSSTYQYFTAASWYTAVTLCKTLDDPTSTKRVHLVVLSSDQERGHVWLNIVGRQSAFWVGLSDTKFEGIYQWVTAEPSAYPGAGGSAWDTGEPTQGTTDNCVRAKYLSLGLDSVACDNATPYVCECDDFADDPSRYALN